MKKKIDFKNLKNRLHDNIYGFLIDWYPDGKVVGKQFIIGDVYGNPGDSFSINLDRGVAKDFSSTDKGCGDLISIYAKKNSLTQFQAAQYLNEQLGNSASNENEIFKVKNSKPAKRQVFLNIVEPPKDSMPDTFYHEEFKRDPEKIYCYRSFEGNVLFFIARYNLGFGEKKFRPFSYSQLIKNWVKKRWPGKQPLYGLHHLSTANDSAWIVIVEGEGCVDIAREVLVDEPFVAVTWPFGAGNADKADWSPIFGKKVLIWPDNDEPGRNAATNIQNILREKCREIMVLSIQDKPEKWDIKDAYNENLLLSLKDFKFKLSKPVESIGVGQ